MDKLRVIMDGMSTEELHRFSKSLYSLLGQITDGESNAIVQNVSDSNGLEAWRVLSKEYDPAGPGRQRNVLSHIIDPGSFELTDLKSAMAKWETQIRTYDRKQQATGY